MVLSGVELEELSGMESAGLTEDDNRGVVPKSELQGHRAKYRPRPLQLTSSLPLCCHFRGSLWSTPVDDYGNNRRWL